MIRASNMSHSKTRVLRNLAIIVATSVLVGLAFESVLRNGREILGIQTGEPPAISRAELGGYNFHTFTFEMLGKQFESFVIMRDGEITLIQSREKGENHLHSSTLFARGNPIVEISLYPEKSEQWLAYHIYSDDGKPLHQYIDTDFDGVFDLRMLSVPPYSMEKREGGRWVSKSQIESPRSILPGERMPTAPTPKIDKTEK